MSPSADITTIAFPTSPHSGCLTAAGTFRAELTAGRTVGLAVAGGVGASSPVGAVVLLLRDRRCFRETAAAAAIVGVGMVG